MSRHHPKQHARPQPTKSPAQACSPVTSKTPRAAVDVTFLQRDATCMENWTDRHASMANGGTPELIAPPFWVIFFRKLRSYESMTWAEITRNHHHNHCGSRCRGLSERPKRGSTNFTLKQTELFRFRLGSVQRLWGHARSEFFLHSMVGPRITDLSIGKEAYLGRHRSVEKLREAHQAARHRGSASYPAPTAALAAFRSTAAAGSATTGGSPPGGSGANGLRRGRSPRRTATTRQSLTAHRSESVTVTLATTCPTAVFSPFIIPPCGASLPGTRLPVGWSGLLGTARPWRPIALGPLSPDAFQQHGRRLVVAAFLPGQFGLGGHQLPRNAFARIACVSFSARAVAAFTRSSILSARAKRASTRRTISCCSARGGTGSGRHFRS